MSRLALIAGQGALPAVLANALGRSGRSWFACHLEGFAPKGVGQSRAFRIERLGSLIADLSDEGVTEVCFAGAIARPPLDPSAVDAATMPLVPRMMQALQAGDDAALRTVIAFFEEAGIAVLGAQDIAPELLQAPQVGIPNDRDLADIARAETVQAALGPLDVGQGCVVAGGQVLAVEALPGTDWMLSSLARRPAPPPQAASGGLFGGDLFGGAADWLSGGAAPAGLPPFARPEGGVFYKAPKPDQDRRIDLPTIGPETVRRVAEAGLSGIAIAADGVLVLDPAEVAAQCTARGLFLLARGA
ncbi:phosphatidate cytidylyltransferase [Jannaschia pagri]|uniref:Phosphatidate cytidylyltransferase n=1 Tax=Jannaschia pagri TaxID=2829797 RepID=A0ABQ4NNZ6_9RHOB|nr:MULTISPECIES: UDP-2,3-diacylglucosamine diphosphatase LpxI [unclassified Jannaschia]GIT91983.1 phosphatidate cytidylyltransferase [Jannaschia sp. AI_61]GIT95817.1 phosphatidate cytidylyltransferase [Jannaschia sp. AI_62]